MSQLSESTGAGRPEAAQPGPSTVWRATLAWPVTTEVGRQERVDGLQQLLSTRAIVGLMGPGRPTRGGMVVDLVLPVTDTRVVTAVRGGVIQPGPVGDDFAWELHRFTGAVVVNGDLATGDFAVLASDDTLNDDELAALLDEPIDSVLLLGTIPTGEVEEAADRLDVNGWISDGARPVVAALNPPSDPTALLLPGSSPLSLALRERPGRVDLMLWDNSEPEASAAPTRRRRAARRAPLLNTHLGARRRAVVLPEFIRPEGSPVAELLERLEEDFAPLSSANLATLGRVLPAPRLNALVAAVNDADTRGLDPEGGVLAPFEEGLMPGEELPASPDRGPHADAAAVLSALGEDPAWLGLLDGVAPTGRGARPLGGALRELAAQAERPQQGQPASGDAAAAASSGPAGAPSSSVGAKAQDEERSEQAKDERLAAAKAASASVPTVAMPSVQAQSVRGESAAFPTLAQAGDREAAALLGERSWATRPDTGGFATLVRRTTEPETVGSFEEILGGADTVAQADVPRPTPAAGTPASSAGDDVNKGRRAWPLVLLILGALVFIAAGIGALFAPNFDQLAGSVYIGAAAAGAVGLGLAIVGAINLRR